MRLMTPSCRTTPTATGTGESMLTTKSARATKRSVKRYVKSSQSIEILQFVLCSNAPTDYNPD